MLLFGDTSIGPEARRLCRADERANAAPPIPSPGDEFGVLLPLLPPDGERRMLPDSSALLAGRLSAMLPDYHQRHCQGADVLCHASHPHADINIFECWRAGAASAALLLKNEALYVVRSQQPSMRRPDAMTSSQSRARQVLQVWVVEVRSRQY